MKSIKSKARIAGVFYLLIFICAGFAEGYVRTGALVPGDPSATAQNILASEGIFRLGLASDLLAFVFDAIVAVLLYVILKPVSKTLSLMAASFRLIAHPAIASLNMLNHFAALAVLDGSFVVTRPESFSLFFMELHSTGYLVAHPLVHRIKLQQGLLAMYLVQGCVGREVRLASESLSGGGGVWKSVNLGTWKSWTPEI